MTGSIEFRLAVECCQGSFRGGDALVARVEQRHIDWATFVPLVRFHRIEGLVWNSLSTKEIPAEVRTCLSEAAMRIAARNLWATAECAALLGRFGAATIPLLFLKGITLGALAYGNAALKDAVDIDLLIDPSAVRTSADVLRSLGYRLVLPGRTPDDEALQAWHRARKESVWTKDSPSVQIDLHTRVADNASLIPTLGVHSPMQTVDVGDGICLPTLAEDELFAYLAVHGASSAWFRLKWVSDFAGLLHLRPADQLERLYRRSQQFGAGRAAGQALLVADALFGTLQQNGALREELARDAKTKLLFHAALRQLKQGPIEPTQSRFGTFRIHWTQFFLLPGIRYKAAELSGQAGRALDRFSR